MKEELFDILFPNGKWPTVAFFDIDGTLAIPRYEIIENRQHVIRPGMDPSKWENYCDNHGFPYMNCLISPVVLDLLQNLASHGTTLCVLSQEDDVNKRAKRAKIQFIEERFSQLFDLNNVFLVPTNNHKIITMKQYRQTYEALRLTAVSSEDIFFLDDNYGNVIDASVAGINAHHISELLV